jgi:hypothetical protein
MQLERERLVIMSRLYSDAQRLYLERARDCERSKICLVHWLLAGVSAWQGVGVEGVKRCK